MIYTSGKAQSYCVVSRLFLNVNIKCLLPVFQFRKLSDSDISMKFNMQVAKFYIDRKVFVLFVATEILLLNFIKNPNVAIIISDSKD